MWDNKTKDFERYHNTDLELKTQLIAAVPKMYTLELLTHLWENSDKNRPADLDHNIQRLNRRRLKT